MYLNATDVKALQPSLLLFFCSMNGLVTRVSVAAMAFAAGIIKAINAVTINARVGMLMGL